jgi:predicted ATPase
MTRADLPSGTVTFLFTDIDGSTALLTEVGPQEYADMLAEHRATIRDAVARHGGVEVDNQGDALFVAFGDASAALAAAGEAQSGLSAGRIRVRMGLHTGEAHATGEGYVGHDVHLGARVAAAGHRGQVLLTKATADIAGLADLTDLGEHRVKDFASPVWIYQLGTDRFPPLKTISNTNLPRPASAFVGREREVGEITELLRGPARLLSLTGPGGTGKTRLSLEVAAELVGDFKNGTFWVDLSSIRDPALVLPTIASTIGAEEALADHISGRQMLLVLDNLEQVVDAAPSLGKVVEACPNLRVLATSRERLRVRDEVEYQVSPLASADAIHLFTLRSGLSADDSVRTLCDRLDNLPLAIELAASRTNVLSPAEITARLSKRLDLLKGGRDAAARQQTLRATIEWSHGLLNGEERRLFARLASLSGGWTIDAAEYVADADLDVLQSLVEKSLIRHAADRFWMLETIRDFATEQLVASDEHRAVRDRHASYFLALGQQAERHLKAEDTEWVDRLQLEQDNLRAALDWLEESGDRDRSLQLISNTWHVWSIRGPIDEGVRRLELALARTEGSTRARAYALTGVCDMAIDVGDYALAQRRCEEALALHGQLADRWGVAYSLLAIGLTHAMTEVWPKAISAFSESADLFEQLGEEHWVLQTKRRLAWSLEESGDKQGARALQEEVYHRAKASNDKFAEGRSLAVLAQYELDQGHVDDRVIGYLKESHRIHGERRDQADLYADAILVCRFALALALRHKAQTAVTLIACFDRRLTEIGNMRERWVERMVQGVLDLASEDLDEASRFAAHELGRRMSVDEAIELAVRELQTDSDQLNADPVPTGLPR